MKTYRVSYKYVVAESQLIEANSKKEAIRMAKEYEHETSEPVYTGESLKCFEAEEVQE